MGTNSTRLLVHDGENTIERLMTITRLGQDVDRTGRLADEAIERVLSCLRTYKSVMDQHGVTQVRAVATSAARDAANRDEFFTAVHDVIGVEPELLSGFDEGKLSFRGATADLDPADGPFLVFDIGGGSTEFAFGTDEAEAAMSLDIGCVRLTEKYVEHDPPRPEELVACLSITEAHLDDVARQMPQIAHAATFVGLAGTVSTAAAVELGLAEYDRDQIHHFVLTKEAAPKPQDPLKQRDAWAAALSPAQRQEAERRAQASVAAQRVAPEPRWPPPAQPQTPTTTNADLTSLTPTTQRALVPSAAIEPIITV